MTFTHMHVDLLYDAPPANLNQDKRLKFFTDLMHQRQIEREKATKERQRRARQGKQSVWLSKRDISNLPALPVTVDSRLPYARLQMCWRTNQQALTMSRNGKRRHCRPT